MKTSALHRKKNSHSYGPLPSTSVIGSSNCGSATLSNWRSFESEEAYLLYHLIAIPCALIIRCAVSLGDRILPRAK